MSDASTGLEPGPEQQPETEVLKDPGFRRLWFASWFRTSADQVATFSLPITAIVLLHARPFEISMISAAGRLGYLLVGLPAGAWVDRWRKRVVLICADLAVAATYLSITLAYWAGVLTVAQLIAAAFVASVASVFFDVAHTSVLPLILTKRRVADANARLQTTDNGIQAVSPSVAGVVTQTVAAPLLYGVGALFQLVSVTLLRGLKPESAPPVKRQERRHLGAEIAEGTRVLLNQPLLRLLTSQAALNNLGAGILVAIIPLFLLATIKVQPWVFGFLSTLMAVSGVVASLVCPRLRRRFGEIRMTIIFSGLAPIAVLVVPVAGLFPRVAVPLIGAAEAMIGFVLVGRSVAAAGLRARVTPTRYMGRVAAASGVITQSTTPVGALLGGLVASRWSTSASLWVGVAIMSLPLVLLLRSPLRRHSKLPPEWEQE